MTPSLQLLCSNGADAAGLGIDWSILGIVMLGVAVLMVVIRGVGLLAANSIPDVDGSTATKRQLSPPARKPALSESADTITPELVAVLTAAATTVVGKPVCLLGIREVSHGNVLDQRAWAQEGRREVYLSHRIR
jgi:Na+-transporting methylmalonyl-CoA/oxaloacetate decarboxylase gamma subunit